MSLITAVSTILCLSIFLLALLAYVMRMPFRLVQEQHAPAVFAEEPQRAPARGVALRPHSVGVPSLRRTARVRAAASTE
jgi:hypothetical protein